MSIQGRVKKPLPEHYQSWEKMLAWVNDSTRDIVRTLTHHIVELGNVKHEPLGRDYAFYKGEPRPIFRFVGLRL